jgi:hypothetical protein
VKLNTGWGSSIRGEDVKKIDHKKSLGGGPPENCAHIAYAKEHTSFNSKLVNHLDKSRGDEEL